MYDFMKILYLQKSSDLGLQSKYFFDVPSTTILTYATKLNYQLLYYQVSDQKESVIWQMYYNVKHFIVCTMVQQGKADGYKLN